jgi:hypothetical protein
LGCGILEPTTEWRGYIVVVFVEAAQVKDDMSNGTLAKVASKTAAEVCGRFPVGEAAAKLLRAELSPAQYLAALMEQHLYLDAIRFLAFALPKREAVWWACCCARSAHGSACPASAEAALHTAEKWLADPSEDNRRAAMPAAEAAGMGDPAGCAAAACFWSGGSLAPPNLPAVPPGEHLTAHGVAGAVMLAAVLAQPERAAEKHHRFLTLGLEVANGAHRWKETTSR